MLKLRATKTISQVGITKGNVYEASKLERKSLAVVTSDKGQQVSVALEHFTIVRKENLFMKGDVVRFNGLRGEVLKVGDQPIFNTFVRLEDGTFYIFTQDGCLDITDRPALSLMKRPNARRSA